MEKREEYEIGCEVRGDGTVQGVFGKILVFGSWNCWCMKVVWCGEHGEQGTQLQVQWCVVDFGVGFRG